MAKGKGYVLGSEPPQDPMSEVSKSTFSVTSSTEIKWNDREAHESWTQAVAVVLFSFILVLLAPQLAIACTILTCVGLFIFSWIMEAREEVDSQSSWVARPQLDLELVEDEKFLRHPIDPKFSLTGIELSSVSPKLPGTMATLLRALPLADGFTLTITLRPGDPFRIIEDRNVTNSIETYLRTRSKSEVDTYMDFRSGLWIAKVNYIGLVNDETGVLFHEASVKGSVPAKGWKRIKPADMIKRLMEYHGGTSHPSYYLVGEELSEWLVQLRSELANEVGTNVPGQFVVDIRSRPTDLPLGNVLNPDTLQTGPVIGLSFEDISQGVLVCGGTRPGRRDVLGLLVKSLVEIGKRVLILSADPQILELVGLDEAAIGLTLGKDFILNPMDAEAVPRNVYVPKLLRALETLADKSLTSAADLEVAIGRAVALPHSTVADVNFAADTDVMTDDEIVKTNIHPVKLSLWGLEGLRKLHEGSGARAFYGTQTTPISTISSVPLSIIVANLGDLPLDIFAFDLLMMKMSGLKADKDLVVVLDDPAGLRVANNSYSRRSLWTDMLIKELSEIASVIVSIDQPHMLSSGVKNELSSCISLRLRDEKDIASVSTRLALSVIGAGLNSKARWSARESSYLRTMEDGVALIVHNEVETAQPIRLHKPLELQTLSNEVLHERIKRILRSDSSSVTRTTSSLLSPTAADDNDLSYKILKLIERYEPLTEEAIRRFIQASGDDGDVEGIILRLKESSLILEGHESHSGVSYKNYRLTMKGNMALRKAAKEVTTT